MGISSCPYIPHGLGQADTCLNGATGKHEHGERERVNPHVLSIFIEWIYEKLLRKTVLSTLNSASSSAG